MEISNLEYALNYLRRGLSVIPVYSPSVIKRKVPKKFIEIRDEALANNKASKNPIPEKEILKKIVTRFCKKPIVLWTEFQTRRPTEAKVREWFTENPDANIAIVTGKISNLCVFDIDSKEALEYANELGGFPDTVKAVSNKGWHYYMQYPEFEVRPLVNKKLEIDIRGEGGYIVAPPSIHGSGHMYEWEAGCSFSEIDPAPCSDWMKEYLIEAMKKEEPDKKLPQQKDNTISINTTTAQNEFTELLKNGCSDGSRNASATRLVGHLFGKNLDADEVWELVSNWNAAKNEPSLSESELRDVFSSIKKAENSKAKPNKENKQDKDIPIASLLEKPDQILAEYDESYIRVPFSGNNLKSLEQKMNGGLIGGRLYILGGIPSAGKTLAVNNIADNVCLNGHPVLFFSFDDGKSELRFRTWSRFSKTSIEAFNKNELEKTFIKGLCDQSQIKKIMGLKYVVQEMVTIDKWDKLISQFIDQYKKAPVIIIDYLRKLKTEKDSSDERLRVDNILHLLTDLAKKHNTPIIAISELARDSYKGGQRLSMASFKESGNIEYEASWLGILSCVEEVNGEYIMKSDWERIIKQDGNVDLIIFKAKRGTGSTGKIQLSMDKDRMCVEDRMDKAPIDTFTKPSKKSMFD
jgi:replicative DNA helicase